MKNQPILQPIEKKRNTFSAEYFSKGAAQYLKDACKNSMTSKFNSFFDEVKKEKELKDKKRIEKINEANRIKEKAKRERFQLKLSIKTKIIAFTITSALAVIYFKKLFDKFPKFSNFINHSFKSFSKWKSFDKVTDDFFNKQYKLNDADIIKATDDIESELQTQFEEQYSLPLKRGVDFFLNLKNQIITHNPYYAEYEKYLTDGQKEHGVMGDFLQQIGISALMWFIRKRGYGAILDILDIQGPEVDEVDMTMWRIFADDRRQYSHIGRNLASPGRAGAGIVSNVITQRSKIFGILNPEYFQRVIEANQSFGDAAFEVMAAMGGVRHSKNKDTVDTNFSQIKDIIMQYDLSKVSKGIYTARNTFIKPKVVYNKATTSGNYNTSEYSSEFVVETTTYSRHDINPFEVQLASVHNTDNDRYTNSYHGRAPFNEIQKASGNSFLVPVVNDAMDYISELYPKIKHDDRISRFVEAGINLMYTGSWFDRGTLLSHQDVGEAAPSGIAMTVGSLMILLQIVPAVAEWEVYQSFQSIKTINAMYNDFMSDNKMEVIEQSISNYHQIRKNKVEEWQIDYARGRRKLHQFIYDYETALAKFLFQEVNLKGNTHTIIFNNNKKLKINFSTFDYKTAKVGELFQGLKDDITTRLNALQKKVKYGYFKSEVLRFGERILKLSTQNINKNNVLVINNKSLRQNFIISNKTVDVNKKIEGQQIEGKETGEVENVYSDNATKVNYKMNDATQSVDFRDQLIFKKSFGDGTPPKFPGLTWGWSALYGSDMIRGKHYWHPNEFGQNGDDGDGAWGFCWVTKHWNEAHIKTKLGEFIPKWAKDSIIYIVSFYDIVGSKSFLVLGSSVEHFPYGIIISRKVGYRKKFAYETYNEKDKKIYLQYVWNYYDLNNNFISSELISQEKSLKSHAGIYEGEYDEEKLKELYNLPTEAIVLSLRNELSYCKTEMKRLMSERCDILDDILSEDNKNWDLKTGNLRIHMLY